MLDTQGHGVSPARRQHLALLRPLDAADDRVSRQVVTGTADLSSRGR
jgi:hypothetical protein